DLGFGDMVTGCVLDWATSPYWAPNYCQDDADNQARFQQVNIVRIANAIREAYRNVKLAMAQAGYHESDYRILAQTYSTPLPGGPGIRYPESGITRQTIGGCGLWNNDANWARNTVVPTLNNAIKSAASMVSDVQVLDTSAVLVSHRLCESTVGLLEEKGLA